MPTAQPSLQVSPPDPSNPCKSDQGQAQFPPPSMQSSVKGKKGVLMKITGAQSAKNLYASDYRELYLNATLADFNAVWTALVPQSVKDEYDACVKKKP
ncbi:hypothetical protein BDQ17DRAFT_1436835 [Cyathus striatus]|nr:hypothetical protein BDQ17DRAFT_1436835 [Cyathus striatus]